MNRQDNITKFVDIMRLRIERSETRRFIQDFLLFEKGTKRGNIMFVLLILFAGIFSGLAIAAKYNAGFLAFGLIFLLIQLRRTRHINILTGLAYSMGGMLLGFLITNPYWIIAPQKFWDGFRLVSAVISDISIQKRSLQ